MAENDASVLGGLAFGNIPPPPTPAPPTPPIDFSPTYTTPQSGRVPAGAPPAMEAAKSAESVDTGPEGVESAKTEPQSKSATNPNHFWERVKDFNSMPSDQYLKKYAADDQRIHDTVQKVVHAIIPLSAEMDQAGQILEKNKVGGQVKEFAQEQLSHPEQLAMGGEFGALGAVESEGAGALRGALTNIGEQLSSLPGAITVAPAGSAHSVKTTAEGPAWERTVRGMIGEEHAGSIGYKTDTEGKARVFGAVVPENMRGQGVGTELYRNVVEDARKQGAKEITSDPTNTTPAALRVWEKLGEKHGYKVEPITHGENKPGFKIDLTQEKTATPRETVENKGLVYKGELTPGSDVHMVEHPEHPGKTAAFEGPVTAEKAQGAINRKLNEFGIRVAQPKTELTPNDMLREYFGETGSDWQSVRNHEAGHAILAADAGMPPLEMRSHLHHELIGHEAGAQQNLDMSAYGPEIASGEYDISLDTVRKNLNKFLDMYMAGGVLQEHMDGLPVNKNSGMGADIKQSRDILAALGMGLTERNKFIEASQARVKERLTDPRIHDIVRKYTADREEGLDEGLHMSADRVRQMVKEVQELKNEGNTNER